MLPEDSLGSHGRLSLRGALAVLLAAATLSLALYWILTIPFRAQEKTQQETNSFEEWLFKYKQAKDSET